MHKKLAADLTSIAHNILQLKNKEDVLVLKEKAYEVYEKLTVLAYVDEYLNTTPNATETKESLLEKIENSVKNTVVVVDEVTSEEEIIIKNKVEEKQTEEKVLIDEVEDFSTKPVLSEVERLEVTETIEIVEEESLEQPFDE